MPTDRLEEPMVQPPYPPPGSTGSGDDDPGSRPWNPPGSDDPTRQIDPPGGPQRDPTRRLPQPGQYSPPGQYGPPGQYPPPGPYGAPDLSAQPVFGQPWGPPPGAPRKPRNTMVGLVVAGVLVLAAVGVALFLFLGNDPGGTATGERPTSSSADPDLPAATVEPDGLGEDPVLDDLAQSCFEGDMSSCDTLYDRSDAGSDYETYGDTCAGRQRSGTFVYCTETFPED